MAGRLLRLSRAAVLLGLAALIAKLFTTGEMVKYMSPALDPLTALTGLALAGLGLREASGREPVEVHAEAGEQVLTTLVLLIPLVLGFVHAPRPLGSSALGGEPIEGLLLSFGRGPASAVAAGPLPPVRPIADTGDLLAYLREAGERSVGQRVSIVGMAARGQSFRRDELALLRYSIAHCVADARPIALLVRADGAAGWRTDQWLRVEGVLASVERDGERVVAIDAEEITATAEPANPYLAAN